MQSSQLTTSTNIENTKELMKFSSYCDSVWDLNYGIDESDCLDWKCSVNEKFYQCQNGQCISLGWVCNGNWDCSDGSDEEGFQLLTESTVGKHNLKLFRSLNTTFEFIKYKCLLKNANRSFKQLCNHNYEYPCLLANVADPLNFTLNRPCIHLEKLGNGIIDCYGGLDERNLLSCSSKTQLGFSFKCNNSDTCKHLSRQCSAVNRCPNGEDRFLYLHLLNDKTIDCKGTQINGDFFDVYCFKGTCLSDAKCNGLIECPFGEDEYYCSTEQFIRRAQQYRIYIQNRRNYRVNIILPNYLQSSSLSIEHQWTNPNEVIQSPIVGMYVMYEQLSNSFI
jgi:hypothetical protein